MSSCKGELMLTMRGESRSSDSSIIQNLKFQDSDGEGDGVDFILRDVSSSSLDSLGDSPKSPRRISTSTTTTDLWDSGLGTPTPSNLRRSLLGNSRQDGTLSPIPFNFGGEDSDDDTMPPLPSSLFTPPHKKFGTLRLHDTPQTPKSLLQRSQRRIINSRPRSGYRSRLREHENRPETNINPFTPNNNGILSRINPGQGIKRPRHTLDRYISYSVLPLILITGCCIARNQLTLF